MPEQALCCPTDTYLDTLNPHRERDILLHMPICLSSVGSLEMFSLAFALRVPLGFSLVRSLHISHCYIGSGTVHTYMDILEKHVIK